MRLVFLRGVAVAGAFTMFGLALHYSSASGQVAVVSDPRSDPRFADIVAGGPVAELKAITGVTHHERDFAQASENYRLEMRAVEYANSEARDTASTFARYGILASIVFGILCLPWNRYRGALGKAAHHAQGDIARLSDSAGKVFERNSERAGPTIMKRDGLTQYSVADEVAKWSKLHKDGLVTEAEFNAARDKLLNRSQ